MELPRSHRRPNLSGQHSAYAPPVFETDGLPKARFVPFSAPSPPRLSRAAWTARRFRYAGAHLSGPHTGHLRPRRHGGPEGDGRAHGKNSGGCPLILPEIPDGPDTEVPRSGPAFGLNGSESGRSEIPQIRSELSIPAKAEESRLICCKSDGFVIAGAGLEDVNSRGCVLSALRRFRLFRIRFRVLS